jgi:hypothetical protein
MGESNCKKSLIWGTFRHIFYHRLVISAETIVCIIDYSFKVSNCWLDESEYPPKKPKSMLKQPKVEMA